MDTINERMTDMNLSARHHKNYYNPAEQLYAGLWTLFGGASVFLGLRIWCKITRRHGLWYDDYILLVAYLILLTTDILITVEYATGYPKGDWNDRMHILINISSMTTVFGQVLSKTAFAVTLLRMSAAASVGRAWQQAFIWFCIVSMNGIMLTKALFQWAKLCERDDYQQWYRIQGWCLNYTFLQNYKEAGNIYNIIMDFAFAMFPWFITWPLNLKRSEKVALCVTLSLGLFIAIITAIRTWWKDTPLMHVHDRWYIWRDAISQIWFSAEVAGTIIVQCIPVLRPFIKDLHTSLTSRRLEPTQPPSKTKGSSWRGSTLVDKKSQLTGTGSLLSASRDDNDRKTPGVFELVDIPEEPANVQRPIMHVGYCADAYYSESNNELPFPLQGYRTKRVQEERWPL